jgi:hypothetical protein
VPLPAENSVRSTAAKLPSLSRCAAPRREQREIDRREAALAQRLDADIVTGEGQHLAGGRRRREEAQLADRKLALGEDVEEFGSDRAGRADDGDSGLRAAQAPG